MIDFDYYKEYLTSISKKFIIMAVLRKANFHSVEIYRLMKDQSCQERSRRKTDSNFNFSQAAKLLMRF